MESQFVSSTRKSAEEFFASGLFCAESVVLALAKAQGIESDLLPKVALHFAVAWPERVAPVELSPARSWVSASAWVAQI